MRTLRSHRVSNSKVRLEDKFSNERKKKKKGRREFSSFACMLLCFSLLAAASKDYRGYGDDDYYHDYGGRHD